MPHLAAAPALGLLAASSRGNPLGSLLPLLIVVALGYLFIRSQRKRQRAQVDVQTGLAPGARVMTTSGMFATVVEVYDDRVVLEVAPGVECDYLKRSVARVVTEPDPEPEVADAADPAEAPNRVMLDKAVPDSDMPDDPEFPSRPGGAHN